MGVDTATSYTATGDKIVVGVLGIQPSSDTRLQHLISGVACLWLALIHYILLELQRVIVIATVAVRVLLQWDLLELLLAAHAFACLL